MVKYLPHPRLDVVVTQHSLCRIRATPFQTDIPRDETDILEEWNSAIVQVGQSRACILTVYSFVACGNPRPSRQVAAAVTSSRAIQSLALRPVSRESSRGCVCRPFLSPSCSNSAATAYNHHLLQHQPQHPLVTPVNNQLTCTTHPPHTRARGGLFAAV
jgi:hypothetical protein